jgi:hypothetical protein
MTDKELLVEYDRLEKELYSIKIELEDRGYIMRKELPEYKTKSGIPNLLRNLPFTIKYF